MFVLAVKGNHVVCFHCDTGVNNWLKTDIPSVEDAQLNPTCVFVTNIKRNKFIQECSTLKAKQVNV